MCPQARFHNVHSGIISGICRSLTFEIYKCESRLLLLLDSGDEVDLHKGISRQLGVLEVDARRAVLSEPLAEHLLERREVALEVLQVAVQLQDGSRRAARLFQHDLDVLQDLLLRDCQPSSWTLWDGLGWRDKGDSPPGP